MWHPPMGRLRFAQLSRTSELPWLLTVSRRCCAMLSSCTRPRRRRAPDGFSAAIARWGWRTFSWAGRRRRSPCCGRHSLFQATNPSSPTRGSSVSAIWPSRPQRWTIGETRNDGRSKRPGWSPKNTSTGRFTAPSRTRQERSRSSSAVTTRRPRASSRTSGGSAHGSAGPRGSTPISRCAAPTPASTSASLPAPSNSRRLRTTHYRDIPMPERFQPGSGASRSGSSEERTTGSPQPSSGSSASCRHTVRSRRSPLGSTSHAPPSRHTSRRSTRSSASQADPKQSRSSSSSASDQQSQSHDPRSRSRLRSRTRSGSPG